MLRSHTAAVVASHQPRVNSEAGISLQSVPGGKEAEPLYPDMVHWIWGGSITLGDATSFQRGRFLEETELRATWPTRVPRSSRGDLGVMLQYALQSPPVRLGPVDSCKFT